MSLARVILVLVALTSLPGCMTVLASGVAGPSPIAELAEGDKASGTWRVGPRETLHLWANERSAALTLTLQGPKGSDSVDLGRAVCLDPDEPRAARLLAAAP